MQLRRHGELAPLELVEGSEPIHKQRVLAGDPLLPRMHLVLLFRQPLKPGSGLQDEAAVKMQIEHEQRGGGINGAARMLEDRTDTQEVTDAMFKIDTDRLRRVAVLEGRAGDDGQVIGMVSPGARAMFYGRKAVGLGVLLV